jgi:hypothetical protein
MQSTPTATAPLDLDRVAKARQIRLRVLLVPMVREEMLHLNGK